MKKLISEMLSIIEDVPKGFTKAVAPEVKPKTIPPEMQEKIDRLEELLERLKKESTELEKKIMEELNLSDLPSEEIKKLREEIKDYMIKEQIAVAECEKAIAKIFTETRQPTALELIKSFVGELEESLIKRLEERATLLSKKKISYIFKIGPRKESIEESVWSKIVDFVKGLFSHSWVDKFRSIVDKLNKAIETV
jgi:hypothetical protein